MINTENTCVSYTAITYKDSWVFWSIHLMHLMLEKLREEGRKCGVYSFFNATEPWVHWSLDNTKQAWQNDPNKLFILDILKYLHGLPCLVKKGKMEKQKKPPDWGRRKQWIDKSSSLPRRLNWERGHSCQSCVTVLLCIIMETSCSIRRRALTGQAV